MKMCAECKFVFDEPFYKEWYEPSGEHWCLPVCPDCGSDDIGEVNEDGEFC